MSKRVGMRPLRDTVRRPPMLSRVLRVYLEIGELPDDDDRDDRFDALMLARSPEQLQQVWIAHGPAILSDWIEQHPGTRPHGWWMFDAPRWRREDLPARCRRMSDDYLRWLCEPRLRIGGCGTRRCEVLNIAPEHRRGLPVEGFVDQWALDYYTGRARDVHGRPIGQEFVGRQFHAQAYDPNDPPTYEAEATYLARHDLLSADERHRLPPDAFIPVALILDDDADDAA